MLAGLGMGPQAIYMWLCDFANTNGDCYPSRQLLVAKIGCDEKTIDRHLKTLVDAGLVLKEARFKDNKQTSNFYSLPLGGGGNFTPGGGNFTPGGGGNLTHRTQPTPSNSTHTSDLGKSQEVISSKGERSYKDVDDDGNVIAGGGRSPSKYPHSKEVFALFGEKYPSHWVVNKTQRAAAERLFELGIEKVRKAITFCREYADEPFFPEVHTPYDLESKWQKIAAWKKKNNI